MGMPKYQWTETENTHYYFDSVTGAVVGMTHKIGISSSIYISKIVKQNDEYYLGRYVTLDHSKKAIETYWMIESRTLLDNQLS